MAAILQTFSDAFFLMKTLNKFQMKFHWNMFLRVKIDNMLALVEIMAWHGTGTEPLSDPMMTQFTDAYVRHPTSVSNAWSHGDGKHGVDLIHQD